MHKLSDLEVAMLAAIKAQGATKEANKAYLEFIKANFIIPIEKNNPNDKPIVLYLIENNQSFLPVFTNMNYLDDWVKDIKENIQLLKLSGVDLLKGIGEDVSLCLDIGSPHYKIFNPGEIARMRSMVIKFFSSN